jgi:hypothetical protein
MPKVFGMHEIELRPGVTSEEYEHFYSKELAPLPELQGWKSYLLKADRGDRAENSSYYSRSRAPRPVIGISPDRTRHRKKSSSI